MKTVSQLIGLFCMMGILLSGCFSRTCGSNVVSEPAQPAVSYKGENYKETKIIECPCKMHKHKLHSPCHHHFKKHAHESM